MSLSAAARHAAILASATDFAIIATDLDARITDWNSGAENVLGWAATDMLGEPVDRIFTPEDRTCGRPAFEMARALSHGSAEDERWHMRADGSWFWANGRMTPLHDGDRHIGFVKILRDQTASRLTAERVQASEETWRATFERIVEGLLIGKVVRDETGHVIDGRCLEMNTAWERMTGYQREDAVGMTIRQLNPDSEDEWIAEIGRVVDTDEPLSFLRKMGVSSRWYEGRVFPLDGDRFGCLFFDVTDRRNEAARRDTLLALDERVRDLVDPGEIVFASVEVLGEMLGASRVGYGELDQELETITIERDWNADGLQSLAGTLRFRDFGTYIDDLKAGHLVAIANVEQDVRTAPTSQALKQIGALSLLNLPIVERGKLVAVLYLNVATPHVWTTNEISIVQEIADRTRVAVERRRAEQSLKELAATLQQQVEERTQERDRVWQVSRDMLGVADNKGVWLNVNPAWSSTLGWPESAFIGQTSEWLEHPDDRHKTREEVTKLAEGHTSSFFENRFRTKDGEYRWLSWSAVPTGGLLYCVARDVTEQKQRDAALLETEEQLRQSQKVEAVGQLTGGVAHDFNNLLTVIRGSIDLLRRPTLSDEKRVRYLDAISDTTDRATRLTSQLLAFARRQTLNAETFDVSASLAGLSEMLNTLVGGRITIDLQASDRPLFVRADRSQFDTAIVNMAVNARDAMAGEGTLKITIDTMALIPAARSHPAVPGRFVAVSLTDTGSGIAPDQLDRIFEPFFTTKGVGHGTGLGLSQVFGFAKQSSGEVIVCSELGAGSTFTLYLPEALEEDHRPAPAEDAIAPLAQGSCILVVEDNIEVGEFATQALAELGYRTHLSVDAASALIELERESWAFDLVFSDVVMPGMSGVELAQEIARRHPKIPVVLTSGYSSVLAKQDSHSFELLRKPYSLEELAKVLARVSRSKLNETKRT